MGGGTYTATYTVVEGDVDVADGANVTTSLAFTDAAGNVGATTPTVTLDGESIDATPPEIVFMIPRPTNADNSIPTTNVPTDVYLEIGFSKEMNTSTVEDSTLRLTR